jgi:hypothetical protein
VVPLHPRHLLSIRCEPRERVKVGSRDEVLAESSGGGVDETEGSNDRGSFVDGVVFENRDEQLRMGRV